MSPAAFAAGAPWAPVMVALHVPAAAQLTAVAIPLAAATTCRAARAGRRSNQIPCPDPATTRVFFGRGFPVFARETVREGPKRQLGSWGSLAAQRL